MSGIGGRRLSIGALFVALASAFEASLLAAFSLPPSPLVRFTLVFTTWATLGLLAAFLFLPSVDLPWRVIRRVPGRRRVALTIDDGPHPESTPEILDALAAARVRATFFLIGSAVERWPALARRISDEGHAIANHTHRHRILIFRTLAQLEDEIASCQRALAPLGRAVRHFRPPHGFKPIGLHRILARHGLRLVSWQGAIRDTDAPGVSAIVDRALKLAGDGRILLLHDNPSCRGETALALPAIIAGYRALGFEFVPLEEGENR